ncbi:hypothetical protein OPV22_022848 [Ensete ventricosum]|uniref:Uncharacterized protein n=1 Tax=Ensete ventricosum TaxID=4639 RepID=A0AAV8PC61_ENSVE|nr:hypothetical protein OPV22_022848 [Ensete ventricosum]
MDNANECDDWELLTSSTSDDESIVALGTVDDVMSHYFGGVTLEEESEEGGIDSDNPSWEGIHRFGCGRTEGGGTGDLRLR